MSKIAVMGTGYVGLSTGACLAHLGHDVACLDIDQAKIDGLRVGKIPIVEEGLEALVIEGLKDGRLSFSVDVTLEIRDSSFIFLCLPTPQGDDGSADLSFIESVLPMLREVLRPGSIVINKSTVPVGTADMMRKELQRDDVSVVSNPEFLRQGTAVRDFLEPARVVIGGETPDAVDAVAALYKKINAPVLRMKTASAEALKYAANAFLATKLTFINAMADICEAVGADVFDVAEGIGLDPRIGSDMLRAGPGWGGSCFPKDTRALVDIAAKAGYDFALLRGVIETNDQHYERIVRKVETSCGGSVRGRTVAAWGLTFKANTDDLRDSPAIKILKILHDEGAIIRSYDPTAVSQYRDHPWLPVVTTIEDSARDAEAIVLLTEWDEFRDVDPMSIGAIVAQKKMIDARNHLDRDRWISAGFEYWGVGR